MEIAAIVKARMEACGYNPTSLSRISGVPQTTILRIVKGQVTPDISTLRKLAPFLKTTDGELATGATSFDITFPPEASEPGEIPVNRLQTGDTRALAMHKVQNKQRTSRL